MNDNADEEQWNRRQAQAAPKAESVQCAEDAADSLRRLLLDLENTSEHGISCPECWEAEEKQGVVLWLEADRAAQRQAGREEAVEKLSAFLSVCVPVTCKTLADIYDPESNGCLFCPNCAEVCPYLISLEKAKPDAGKEE